MIKFFRTIRQRLIAENPPDQSIRAGRFTRYLIYAIGEIVLVVIGILIALQINTSNTYKEQRKTEQEYLSSLKAEFESNLKKLDVSIQDNEMRRQALEGLLSLFDKAILDTVSARTMSKRFHTVFGNELDYEPAKGVLSDLISSGNLNIILNKDLRQQLASFESSLAFLNIQIDAALRTKENLLRLFHQRGSVRNVIGNLGTEFEHGSISEEVDNKQLFDSIEFENYLMDYLLVTKAANGPNFLGGLKEEIDGILKEIDKELE